MHLFLIFIQQPCKFCNCIFNAVIDDIFYLKLVLVVGVMLSQVPKLLGQIQTVLGELRTYKILCYLDAVVQISHLINEHCIVLQHPMHFIISPGGTPRLE